MDVFRIIIYTAGMVSGTYDFELPSLSAALLYAEFLLNPERDKFVDQVRVIPMRQNHEYQIVYKLERFSENSENYGL